MEKEEIVIIDTGIANIASVANMLKKAGAKAIISSDKQLISSAGKLILPGLGAFDTAMKEIRRNNIDKAINKAIYDNQAHLLGICLGMQLLFEHSEEGSEPGLGLIPGIVRAFDRSKISREQRIPNMGWRYIEAGKSDTLFKQVEEPAKFYFVHSYHAPLDTSYATAYCTHGYRFPCAVTKGKVSGVQFHPEKSHKYGLTLLKNFAGIRTNEA
jgi:glutamine amidotransferase